MFSNHLEIRLDEGDAAVSHGPKAPLHANLVAASVTRYPCGKAIS